MVESTHVVEQLYILPSSLHLAIRPMAASMMLLKVNMTTLISKPNLKLLSSELELFR